MGPGMVLRQALLTAKPWQRYVIAVTVVIGGAVLVMAGHVGGALLSVSGILLLWRMLRYRLTRSKTRTDDHDGHRTDW